jgi:TP901 family phage tail tape measure protein
VAVNIVEILVKAKDMTKEGFAAADASSTAMADGIKKAGAIAAGALGVVAAESVKMAATYDSAMTKLQTQAGVTGTKMAQLKTGVLQLASQVGFSPDSLAESMFHVASNMASLGASAPKMLSVVKTAAQGAAVGGADLVDVTNALTAAVASGIPGVQNYQQAMGMLNATVGAGDMKMQDLAEAFGSGMVATVKGFGLSLKDVGAALATFGDNNIRGAHAGTQLRMSVMALAAPVKTGVANLQQMGIGANQLAKDMQHGGLMPALQDLISHMRAAGVTAKEQGMVITNDFGKKAGAGLNVLLDQMDRLKSKYPDLTAGANKFGQAWKTTQGTFTQQMHELTAGFDALMISIGNKLLPVVQSLVSLMLRHKQVTLDVLAAVAALAGALAVMAGVIKTVEIVTKAWAGVQAILDAELLANPIGLIILSLVALAAGIYMIVKHWHTLSAETVKVWDVVKHAVLEAVDKVRQIIGDVIGWIKAHWPLLVGILGGPIGLAVALIVTHWHQLVAGVQAMVGDVFGWFKRLPGMILNALGDLGHLLWQGGVNLVMGLVHGIESMAMAPVHALGSIISGVRSLLPFSPAKTGPLSGPGSPDLAGQKIPAMLAAGMDSRRSLVAAAALRMAAAASPRAGGAGAGGLGLAAGGQAVRIQLEWVPGAGASQGFVTFLQNTVRARGGDPAMFDRKVAFRS